MHQFVAANLLHIPYKGGKIRALAVTSLARAAVESWCPTREKTK